MNKLPCTSNTTSSLCYPPRQKFKTNYYKLNKLLAPKWCPAIYNPCIRKVTCAALLLVRKDDNDKLTNVPTCPRSPFSAGISY